MIPKQTSIRRDQCIYDTSTNIHNARSIFKRTSVHTTILELRSIPITDWMTVRRMLSTITYRSLSLGPWKQPTKHVSITVQHTTNHTRKQPTKHINITVPHTTNHTRKQPATLILQYSTPQIIQENNQPSTLILQYRTPQIIQENKQAH